MKTLFSYIKILVVFGIIIYGVASVYLINNNKEAFNSYRTVSTLKDFSLQDACDAIKDGKVNMHTKINYGIKPYITFAYDYIKATK